MENKILLTQIYAGKGIGSEFLFRNPSKYKKLLLATYPQIKSWIKDETFDQLEPWPDDVSIQFNVEEVNLQGRFLAANIDTPSKVIDDTITPDLLLHELVKDSYTHVGFSVISNDYSNFLECAEIVKDFDSSIKTIVGGPGALFPQSKDVVDYICRERGDIFLRRLFNEDINKPPKLIFVPNHVFVQYRSQKLPTELYRTVTKVGCPLSCDFCTTPVLYDGKYSKEFFSPQYVHDELVAFRDQLKKDKITVYFEEPTSFFNLDWWYEFIDLFREDSGDFAFYVYSISTVLDKLDLERVSNSAARINYVNFGIESFNKNYPKNYNVDLKALVRKLRDYGIWTNPNYIIGYDFDSKESVWEDVNKLINLEADVNTVLHLHPHPMTQVWQKLESEKRLLDIPPEFYYLHGFQSFEHPHFKAGFDDMLPLLYKIYNHIAQETGDKLISMVQTLKNLLPHTNHPKMIKGEMMLYKSVGRILYPHWKEFFNPNELQDAKFQSKLK